jgi:hypothetical protein
MTAPRPFPLARQPASPRLLRSLLGRLLLPGLLSILPLRNALAEDEAVGGVGHAHHEAPATAGSAEPAHSHSFVPPGLNLIGFLSAGYTHLDNQLAQIVDGKEGQAEGALLVTYGADRFRFLAEGVVSTEEAEIERLQFGFDVTPGMVIWLGRVHQPSSYWNTEFHHGQYLQSSITRPAIESWEDDGGALVQHVGGILAETEGSLANGTTVRLNVSAGLAPSLTTEGLSPISINHGFHELHHGSFAARLDILPDGIGEQAYGLIAGHGALEARQSAIVNLDHIKQTTLGAYGDIETGAMRWLATVYLIRNHFDYTALAPAATEHHTSWFLHGERHLSDRWLVYARHESTSGTDNPGFRQLFPEFISRRSIAGLRLASGNNHALSVEVGRARAAHQDFQEFRVQWSAVFN